MKHSRQRAIGKVRKETKETKDLLKNDPDFKCLPLRTHVSHLCDHTLDMSMEINHKYDRFRKGYQLSW